MGVQFPPMKDKLKNASLGALGCAVMVGVLFLAAFMVVGVVWVSDKILPWLNFASVILLAICIFILSPMCIFRTTRPIAGMWFYFGSYVFGLTLWVLSCLVCYDIWGYRALIIGLLVAGVGVAPMALIASIFTGHWSTVRDLLIPFVLMLGTRVLGIWLTSHTQRQYEEGIADY
jgi:hypothetical protein